MTLEEIMQNKDNVCLWINGFPKPVRVTGRYTVVEANEHLRERTMVEVDRGIFNGKSWESINHFTKIEALKCGK